MPLRDFKCKVCGKEREYLYSSSRHPECGCGGALEMLPLSTSYSKGSVFPFTTTHIDAQGRPLVIESLGHLRSVERKYGVVLSAFSNEPSNPSPIRDLPRYRG